MNNWCLSALLLAAGVGLSVPSTARANPHADVSLLSETDQPRPGSTFPIGIRIVPASGWHSYWSNPGDSGIAPTIQWRAVPGVRFGPLLHPAPTLLTVAGITSYVHAGEHILLARVRANPTLKRGTLLPIQARLIWATCSESLCVPERTTLALNLRVGNGVPNSWANGIERAVSRLPQPMAEGIFRTSAGVIRMEVPKAAQLNPAQATFFPHENGIVSPSTFQVRSIHGRTQIIGHVAGRTNPSRISGVLSDGKKSYVISMRKVN
jgi:DsbC/DsbD-like thiol-disulfide interchange protein